MSKGISVKKIVKSQEKLHDLQKEIAALQEREKTIHQEMVSHISTLLSSMGALTIPQNVLIGGILHTIDAFQTNDPQVEKWEKLGKQFLLQKKKNSKSRKEITDHSEAQA